MLIIVIGLLSALAQAYDPMFSNRIGTMARFSTTAYSTKLLSTSDVVVAGVTNGNLLLADQTALLNPAYFVQLYSSTGSLLWTRMFVEIAVGAVSVDVDSSDYIYAVGGCRGNFDRLSAIGPNADICIVKYDSAGNKIFSKREGGGGFPIATNVFVDNSRGLLYVMGNIFGGSTTPTNSFAGYTPAVSTTDAYYLPFSLSTGQRSSIVVSTQNPSGKAASFDAAGVDRFGDVWLVGYTDNANFGNANGVIAGMVDMFVHKRTLSASPITTTTKIEGGLGEDKANAVAFDSAGNAYVSGYTRNAWITPNKGGGIFLFKYDRTVTKQYLTMIGNIYMRPFGMALDERSGRLFFAGHSGSVYPYARVHVADMTTGAEVDTLADSVGAVSQYHSIALGPQTVYVAGFAGAPYGYDGLIAGYTNPTPTASPTTAPTRTPTRQPTRRPTASPSFTATRTPTRVPTIISTVTPTTKRTNAPSAVPTRIPTRTPTRVPSVVPTRGPTRTPSVVPTRIPTRTPTSMPSILVSAAPTFDPSELGQVTCGAFSVFNTADATRNFATCQIVACQGRSVQVSLCASDSYNLATCSGDTYLRVFDATGNEIASNDNFCGACSGLTFRAAQQCGVYTIVEGCAGNGLCSGTVAVSFGN
jgi:hypothetical protein